MCRCLMASIPDDTDLKQLEASIPSGLKQSLLRRGFHASWPQPRHFGFQVVDNSPVRSQLPTNDLIVTMTRVVCDCWSTLGSDRLDSKEASRWRSVLECMRAAIPRFAFLVHFGTPSDAFVLKGPEVISLSDRQPLQNLRLDTLYEILS